MNRPSCFFIISQWNNDVSWINDFETDDYIIFDKSNTLPEDIHILKIENKGYNIFDISAFCYYNYDNLPNLLAFVEGSPFDHCEKETFNKLIYNTKFTPLEDYSNIPEGKTNIRDSDGGYLEWNDSWYLATGNSKFTHQWYGCFDEFMEDMFINYKHIDWIRFAPGAQYIVPKKNILYYSRDFWNKLMGTVSYSTYPVEAMIIERALWYIFSNKYKERKPTKYE